jgi:hypothetical protein
VETVLFPEIPCGFDDKWEDVYQYIGCVDKALTDIENQGLISLRDKSRFFISAIRAYRARSGSVYQEAGQPRVGR